MEEELAETEAELGEGKRGGKARKANAATGWRRALSLGGILSPVLVETFVITFLAEWGDRSQIATIGLAASSDPYGVTLEASRARRVYRGAAVVGGSTSPPPCQSARWPSRAARSSCSSGSTRSSRGWKSER